MLMTVSSTDPTYMAVETFYILYSFKK